MIPIIESSHYGTYGGDAYETYKKLTKGMNPIIPNKIYINDDLGQIFYVNNSGYLHVYDKDNEFIVDLMLTKDNKLKEVSHQLLTKSTKEKFRELLKDAEHI